MPLAVLKYKKTALVLKILAVLKYKKISSFAIVVLACILRNIFWKIYNKIRGYPNGPMGLPLFGCFFQFSVKPRKFLFNIADSYGGIAYTPFMISNNIVISDPKILRLLYKDKKIIDRPSYFATRPKPTMFADISGKKWRQRRKYCMETVMTVANSSFVLSNVAQCIDNYIKPIMDKKHIQNNELWFSAEYLQYISFNNIWSAVFDQVLPLNDPFIKSYVKFSDVFVQKVGVGGFLDLATNGKCPAFIKQKMIWKYTTEFDDILLKWMNNNGFIIDLNKNILERINENEYFSKNNKKSKVYIDFLLHKLKNKEITIPEIVSDIHQALAASIDTTTKSAEYGFLLLAKYSHIQEMVYNELVSVMKKNNLKQFNFKILNELHIFRAFIHEILRIAVVVPLPLPHAAAHDNEININGKKIIIPKCTIQANMYYIHKYLDWGNNNKPLKEENNSIHLEYWLDPIDKKFKMNTNFVQFGVGKRDCVGQSMAMRTLYAILGTFMTKYKFMPPNNNPNSINIKQSFGIVMTIEPPIGIHIQRR